MNAYGKLEDEQKTKRPLTDFAPLLKLQVQRYRIPTYPLFQLPQLAQMQRLRHRPLHRRRVLAQQGRLQAQLVQIRGHGSRVGAQGVEIVAGTDNESLGIERSEEESGKRKTKRKRLTREREKERGECRLGQRKPSYTTCYRLACVPP